jgi:3-isopropylmalate dehydrogenase
MPDNDFFTIAVLPGDGIGAEVMTPCLAVIEATAQRIGGLSFRFTEQPAGAICYRDTGVALPPSSLQAARDADAILLGAMGWPAIRYPDGTEIAPQLDLRFALDLYAGVRPVRTLPHMRPVLSDTRARDLDFIIIRESTEGLFASRGKGTVDDDHATDTLVITRKVCEPLFDFAFDLSRLRKRQGGKGVVTCVDKANVFTSMAFFRKIFDERAALNPDIEARHAYVDATAMFMVQKPWELDVLVMENMFGDILSDLGAGLMGGLGLAPSADIGERHAVFQPCHGTAPDIAGHGKANPTAMFLSGAMMLEWLADKHDRADARRAAQLLCDAINAAYAEGLRPIETGGNDGTAEITRAVLAKIATVELGLA